MKDARRPMPEMAHTPIHAGAGGNAGARPGAAKFGRAASHGGVLGGMGLALLLGVSYGLFNSPSPHLETAQDLSVSALAWPGPAIGIALLWRRRLREWPLCLLAGAAALALVGAHSGDAPRTVDLALAAIGLSAVALGAWLGQRWVAPDGQLDSSRRLLLFTLLLPVALCLLLSVCMTAALGWGAPATQWLGPLQHVYVAQAMSVLVLVPALLAWRASNAGAVLRDRGNWMPTLAALACLALALVPRMHDEVVRAALTLPLCWAAVRSGMVLVAQLNAAISIGMTAITLAGRGPYVEYGYGMWTLQVDLIGIAVLSLLLAVTIGERQRLTARLDQARRFESLGFLAGGIAHDFNNVLGTIRACAEIAAERLPPGSGGLEELAQMARATERGMDMTQQILLAARQGDPARGRVDLGEVVDEVVASARALCPAHIHIERYGIEHHGIDGAASPVVLANRGQLVRAVQNLLRNATQAARGQVTLSVGTQTWHGMSSMHGASGMRGSGEGRFDVRLGEPPSDRARGWVEVADDGPGIDAAHWAHLFDPFYSTRFAQGGSGLGLAIVAGVASGHGGFIGMATRAQRGTVFRLEIPLVEPGAQGSPHVPHAPQATLQSKEPTS